MTATDELLPCPFCGSNWTRTSAGIYAGPRQLSVTIACRECGASVWGFTTNEAIAAWNRRADHD